MSGLRMAPTSVAPGTYVLTLGDDLAAIEGFAEYCDASGYKTSCEPGVPTSKLNGISEKNDPVVRAALAILREGFGALCEKAAGRCDA
jgi:hypothetical protein